LSKKRGFLGKKERDFLEEEKMVQDFLELDREFCTGGGGVEGGS
jgi:hypothetical protein